VASNRINMPQAAEQILADGHVQLVSMARPLLSDPDWVNKANADAADEINTCIACNQACLDHVFEKKLASCLVNPRACHETELLITPAVAKKRIAVVGAGPAGLACATTLGERGHAVTLFEQSNEIGGQFNMAKRVPGKEEFHETLRYYARRIEQTGVQLHLGTRATQSLLREFDDVVIATGVMPRAASIPGSERANVVSYLDVLLNGAHVGAKVAIIGAGGIGFDVAEFLVEAAPSPSTDVTRWTHEWGIDTTLAARSGLLKPAPEAPVRQVWLLQRTPGKPGKRLNKTSGWVHRATLAAKRVTMLGGVAYERIDDEGLHIRIGDDVQVLPVDTVVICAGQESNRTLHAESAAAGIKVHLIGGADVAAELDAKRAIDQGTRLAAML
jgi:2,4-dienoyl-CoA reductase (NADPH2)